jgi:hypothetical protein
MLTMRTEWKDELDKLAQPPPPSQAQMSSEPLPSQRQRADIARGLVTPSPKKRSRSPTSSQMTPSQKRLADIQAALGEPEVGAGKQNGLATIEGGITSTSQVHPPPQIVDESDDDDVFHSAVSATPHSAHLHIHFASPEAPRTPKRQKLDQEGSSSLLMTPWRSDGIESRNGFMTNPPESPSKGKRKERDGEGGETSQWQRIMADPDSPYHDRAASLRAASQYESQTRPSSSQNTMDAAASNATPESIKALIGDLYATLPPYMAKLERKQIASERSSEVKAKKIEELQSENAM